MNNFLEQVDKFFGFFVQYIGEVLFFDISFNYFRFDIILDSSLKPWLLEINHRSSLACNTPLDRKIKQGVVKDTL